MAGALAELEAYRRASTAKMVELERRARGEGEYAAWYRRAGGGLFNNWSSSSAPSSPPVVEGEGGQVEAEAGAAAARN